MENQNMENQGAAQQTDQQSAGGNPQGGQQQEKRFTQEDVNRIVGERLARVKSDVSPELQEREQKLAQRELYLDARERLADAGLPKDLIKALNCNSKEEMENSIKTIQSFFGKSAQQSSRYRVVSTGISSSGPGSGGSVNGADDPASIRKAMGLKG